MCGIVGIYYFDPSRRVEPADLRAMADRIVHRGPDDDGYFVAGNVGLGMRRLSIIDIAGGHQPIQSADGHQTIVFNGEAYNYRDHRKALEASGYPFKTHADTEVVLALYQQQGASVLPRLNGMFGLAIWDDARRDLLLARDRMGIKPLYYYQDRHQLVFASEIKAILAAPGVDTRLDLQALDAYLRHGFTPAPLTLFENIRKLPPAHSLRVHEDRIDIDCYWRPSFKDTFTGSFDEAKEALYAVLRESVQSQMIADVPIGAFLSGGFDSSGIVHLMSELQSGAVNTYTVGFGADNAMADESAPARRFAGVYGTNHHEILVEPDVVGLFPHLIHLLDEPLADSSFILTYLVSKLARESSTVILSGVGGDELFGGYRRYLNTTLRAYADRIPRWMRDAVIRPLLHTMPSDRGSRLGNYARLGKAFFAQTDATAETQYAGFTTVLSDEARRSLTGQPTTPDPSMDYFGECDGPAVLDRLMYYDLMMSLPEQLLMLSDKMSMAASIEARVPFLDNRVVEFAASLPAEMKIQGMKTRQVQKEAFRSHLPSFVFEQQKKGFGAPIGTWFRYELKEMVETLLGRSHLQAQGLFNSEATARLIDEHYSRKQDHTDALLCLLSFQIWHEGYFPAPVNQRRAAHA